MDSILSRDDGDGAVLTWTTEKPTKAGWYWYRAHELSEKMVVSIRYDKVWVAGINGGGPIDGLGGDWAGPLEPPA